MPFKNSPWYTINFSEHAFPSLIRQHIVLNFIYSKWDCQLRNVATTYEAEMWGSATGAWGLMYVYMNMTPILCVSPSICQDVLYTGLWGSSSRLHFPVVINLSGLQHLRFISHSFYVHWGLATALLPKTPSQDLSWQRAPIWDTAESWEREGGQDESMKAFKASAQKWLMLFLLM